MRHAAFLLAVVLAPTIATGEEPTSGFLTGRVVSTTGGPVAGATVGCNTVGPRGLVTTTTDAAGRFVLGPLPPQAPRRYGANDLYAEAPGLARQYLATPAVIPNARNDVGDVRLEPGVVASGKVTDDRNQPLQGVSLWIVTGRADVGGMTRPYGAQITVFTNAEGRYETPPLPFGFHYLEFRAGAREHWTESLEIRLGTEGKFPTVALEPSLAVTGTVVDEGGKPIEGALVSSGASNRATALTDPQGRYSVPGYGRRSAKTELRVTKVGYAEATTTVVAVNPTVVLKALGGFVVRVVDAGNGKPVAIGSPLLERLDRDADGKAKPPMRVYAVTAKDEPGRYRLYAPDLGTYRLTVRATGYDNSEPVDLPPLTERKLADGPTVKLKAADPAKQTRVEGVVQRGGKPIANSWAALYLPYEHPNQPVQVARGRVVPPMQFGYE